MANNFRTKTKYSASTNYFRQEDGTAGTSTHGDSFMLEDGTGNTASPTTTHGGKFATEETSNNTFYQCPDSTTTIVLSMSIINKYNEPVSCIVYLNSTTSETKTVSSSSVTETNENITLLHSIPIPVNTTLEVMSGQKIVLQQTDSIVVKANKSNAVDITMSVMEIS